MTLVNTKQKTRLNFYEKVINKAACGFTQHDQDTKTYFIGINVWRCKPLYSLLRESCLWEWNISQQSIDNIMEECTLGASIAIFGGSDGDMTYYLSMAAQAGVRQFSENFICIHTPQEKRIIEKYMNKIDDCYNTGKCHIADQILT